MSATVPTTPFPLGAYLGNPDNSSASNEATFEAGYNGLSQLMGATPQFLVSYVDQNQPISQWVGNAQWAATSAAQSVDAKGMTPVIGLPMTSTAAGSLAPDQSYQAFASGQYDSVIAGLVQTWAAEGFKTQYWRPGWEMNLTSSSSYAGSDAQTQADWVKAFQHIYTVLHQAAQADGVTMQVIWNPGTTNYSNAEATTSLYPGNNYVDVIGADAYSDIRPYSDSSGTPTYHDWDTGAEDTSVAQFIADPVNREHYWTYPAATKWSSDGSGGHSLSLDQLLAFAQAQGKPFAIPETGAGNSNAGTDVNDDATFPQWLSQQLTTAQAAGEKIDLADLWDSNGGGNYAFSSASDNKPGEAAAWAKYFGAATVVGSGPDTLMLSISEDAWKGNAQFTISIDGKQVGGTQTATASHGAGQVQIYDVAGNFKSGAHTATVNFLNDAYGGSASADRNLYVQGAAIDGTPVAAGNLTMDAGGPQSFSFNEAAYVLPDTLNLQVSEDAWQGNAQFTVTVDGVSTGTVYSATASHAAGATQGLSLAGRWGAGAHTIGIAFINDAYGGSSTTDRNLYVNQVAYDGQTASGAPVALMSNGTANFTVPVSNTQLTLHMAEDAWQGDAQYSVAIDGKTVIQNGTVTATNALGQSQAVNLQAMLTSGTHDLAISFLNGANGGTQAAGRNLNITGIDMNHTQLSGTAVAMMSTQTTHFQILVPST